MGILISALPISRVVAKWHTMVIVRKLRSDIKIWHSYYRLISHVHTLPEPCMALHPAQIYSKLQNPFHNPKNPQNLNCHCYCLVAQSCPTFLQPHGFSRQEYWSRWPFPLIPNLGIEPESPELAGRFFNWEAWIRTKIPPNRSPNAFWSKPKRNLQVYKVVWLGCKRGIIQKDNG